MTEKAYRNYQANRKYQKNHGYPKGWNPYKYSNPISMYHYQKLSEEEINELLEED